MMMFPTHAARNGNAAYNVPRINPADEAATKTCPAAHDRRNMALLRSAVNRN